MQQSGEIGARRNEDARPKLFRSARSPNSIAGFQDEHALAGAGKVGGAGEAVVAAAGYNDVPAPRGERRNGFGKTDGPSGGYG